MAVLDWSQCPAVKSIPGKVSGAWVFKGTRLPIATVIENLEDLTRLHRENLTWAGCENGTGDRSTATNCTAAVLWQSLAVGAN